MVATKREGGEFVSACYGNWVCRIVRRSVTKLAVTIGAPTPRVVIGIDATCVSPTGSNRGELMASCYRSCRFGGIADDRAIAELAVIIGTPTKCSAVSGTDTARKTVVTNGDFRKRLSARNTGDVDRLWGVLVCRRSISKLSDAICAPAVPDPVTQTHTTGVVVIRCKRAKGVSRYLSRHLPERLPAAQLTPHAIAPTPQVT